MKIAIAGTGKVARQNYIPYLAKQDDVELLYTNRTPAKARECAAAFGGTYCETIEQMMAAAPDAVLVLTREMDRYDAALAILEHSPKRLFFEKPLVAQQDQAHVCEDDFLKGREIMQRAAAAGTATAMVFNYRFFDQSLRASRLVEDRGFGTPIQAMGLVHYACWSHCIDLVHAFCGPALELASVSGRRVRGGTGLKAPDVAAAFVTECGAGGTIIGTCGTDFRFPLFELVLSFEGGRISFRGLDGDMEVLDNASGTHQAFSLPRQTSRWDQYAASFDKSLAAYLDSIRNDTPAPVPGLAGLQELQFEAALRRASREQRSVSVQEEFCIA